MEQGISTREQIDVVTAEQALEEEFFLGLRQLAGALIWNASSALTTQVICVDKIASTRLT